MASQSLSQTHQSTTSLAGAWKLASGQAMSLQPREPGLLRVARGGLWATSDGPHPGPLNDQGDRILQAGEQLQLRQGQRVVIEAWSRLGPAYFTWDPLPQAVAHPVRAADLVQAAEEALRLDVMLRVRATGRLLVSLAGLVRARFGGARPEADLAECAFRAHSSA